MLTEIDTTLTARLQRIDRPGFIRHLAAVLAHSGDSWFWLIGLGFLWLLGGEEAKSLALRIIASILLLGLIIGILKYSVRRNRPEGEWGAIYRKTDPHSFPSGHSARAFLLTTLCIGWGTIWLATVLFVWAISVSLARVTLGLHYLSDVIAGALTGAIVAITILFLTG